MDCADWSAADTIHRLPLAHQNTALANLRLRYESLAAMSSDLPSNISTPPSIDPFYLPDQASSLLISPSQPSDTPTASTPSETQAPIDAPAFILAMFGWQAEPSTIAGLASCAACFRRLGLWLFKPSFHPSSPRSPSSSPPPMSRLDVVAEHREYCPWINASSQAGGTTSSQTSTASLAGWELLLRAITNAQQSRRDVASSSLSDERRADNSTVDGDPSGANEDATGSLRSVGNTITTEMQSKDLAARDEKDKERWAKLKRLKSVFQVKRGKGKVGDQRKGVSVGAGVERSRSSTG